MYKKGTVVLIPFPFTDLSGTKIRPSVIVSDAIAGNDVVVLFISSQKEKTSFDVVVEPTETNGLKTKSKIKCSKLATLDKKIILGELGTMPKDTMQSIDTKLKQVLGLNS